MSYELQTNAFGGPVFHKKRDGWLMIRRDGSCRFLNWWEGFMLTWFWRMPSDQ